MQCKVLRHGCPSWGCGEVPIISILILGVNQPLRGLDPSRLLAGPSCVFSRREALLSLFKKNVKALLLLREFHTCIKHIWSYPSSVSPSRLPWVPQCLSLPTSRLLKKQLTAFKGYLVLPVCTRVAGGGLLLWLSRVPFLARLCSGGKGALIDGGGFEIQFRSVWDVGLCELKAG